MTTSWQDYLPLQEMEEREESGAAAVCASVDAAAASEPAAGAPDVEESHGASPIQRRLRLPDPHVACAALDRSGSGSEDGEAALGWCLTGTPSSGWIVPALPEDDSQVQQARECVFSVTSTQDTSSAVAASSGVYADSPGREWTFNARHIISPIGSPRLCLNLGQAMTLTHTHESVQAVVVSSARDEVRLAAAPDSIRKSLCGRRESTHRSSTQQQVGPGPPTALLEPVDRLVKLATELAVDALRLGKTEQAQRILKLADNMYVQCGVEELPDGAHAVHVMRPALEQCVQLQALEASLADTVAAEDNPPPSTQARAESSSPPGQLSAQHSSATPTRRVPLEIQRLNSTCRGIAIQRLTSADRYFRPQECYKETGGRGACGLREPTDTTIPPAPSPSLSLMRELEKMVRMDEQAVASPASVFAQASMGQHPSHLRCVCVCMYVCVCMCVCVCVCVIIRFPLHARGHAHDSMCVCAYMYTYTHTHIHTYTHTHIHTYTHTHTHEHAHTHAHTHTHIQTYACIHEHTKTT